VDGSTVRGSVIEEVVSSRFLISVLCDENTCNSMSPWWLPNLFFLVLRVAKPTNSGNCQNTKTDNNDVMIWSTMLLLTSSFQFGGGHGGGNIAGLQEDPGKEETFAPLGGGGQ
jgi:hypothetical protein